jgi:phosphate transport system substrate-binding protein
LGRPLFIYASKSAAAKPEVLSFLEFYVANNEAITTKALFVPLSAEQKTAAQAAVAGLK